jgi:hypothetical protein
MPFNLACVPLIEITMTSRLLYQPLRPKSNAKLSTAKAYVAGAGALTSSSG